MANHSYLRVWTRDFSDQTMIAEFARFLTTAPLSASQSTFTELLVQPVNSTEPSVAEWDLRAQNSGPAEVAALAAQNLNSDSAYIATANWDLWRFDVETLTWRHEPLPRPRLRRRPRRNRRPLQRRPRLRAFLYRPRRLARSGCRVESI
jgi:hypothetical protein